MECLVTICSKEKNKSPHLLPAHLRYNSKRIQDIYKKSKELNIPLYIISGKYGLISAEETIPLYDQLLTSEDVQLVADVLAQQIKLLKIKKVYFYIKEDTSWEPYINSLELAISKTQCLLEKITYLNN